MEGGKIYNKGELIFNNGSRYIGEFNNGTFHGIGELYDWKGDLIFSGKFIDGKYEKKSQKDIFKNIPNLNLFKKAKKIGEVDYERIKFNENPKRNNYFKNSKRISSNNDSEPAKKETNYKNIKLKISELKQQFNSIVQSDNENVDLKEVLNEKYYDESILDEPKQILISPNELLEEDKSNLNKNNMKLDLRSIRRKTIKKQDNQNSSKKIVEHLSLYMLE